MDKNSKFKIDSFFSGVGGIELGFEQTGEFETIYANEFDKNAQITYKNNYPNIFLDTRDIHDINPVEFIWIDDNNLPKDYWE